MSTHLFCSHWCTCPSWGPRERCHCSITSCLRRPEVPAIELIEMEKWIKLYDTYRHFWEGDREGRMYLYIYIYLCVRVCVCACACMKFIFMFIYLHLYFLFVYIYTCAVSVSTCLKCAYFRNVDYVIQRMCAFFAPCFCLYCFFPWVRFKIKSSNVTLSCDAVWSAHKRTHAWDAAQSPLCAAGAL